MLVDLSLIMLVLTSISILDGNWAIWRGCRLIAEVENNLFANSLIGTTSSKRKKSDEGDKSIVYC